MTAQTAGRLAYPKALVEPVELFPDRLYLLGDTGLIDGNYTWRDESHDGRHESFNAYLLLSGSGAAMIETGVAMHGDTVRRQIDAVLGGARRLTAVVGTRLEPDCFSNLPSMVDRSGGQDIDVYAPGGLNPLDFFDDLSTQELMKRFGVRVILLRSGIRIELGGEDALDVTVPSLRTLSTGWIYDPVSAALFSSDCFSHYSTAPGENRVVGAGGGPAQPHTGEALLGFLGRHHLTKFDWLRRADVGLMIREIEQLFNERPVRTLAPTRGCVIRGEDEVRRNVDALLGMLRAIRDQRLGNAPAEPAGPRKEAHGG
ncbi:MAG: hypothetical protein GEU78_13050 [Actinobacteria bacterium]|nr:hypothetical protein [Actinomycetota bacterium]